MFRKFTFLSLLILAAVAMTFASSSNQTSAQDDALGARVYELRTYHCHPGKLDDLHARFRDHTNYLFVRHGMTLIGYWTPDGEGAEDTLVYIIAHESREQAKKNWAAFASDPDWQKAAAASKKNGPILTGVDKMFLNPTDYSPIR